MAMTAIQAAEQRARAHGIAIEMVDDYARCEIVVRGRKGDIECQHRIAYYEVRGTRAENIGDYYATIHHKVIDALIGEGGEDMTQRRINELERELEKYKSTVKQLAFELEMSRGSGRAGVREDEVRRLALEQAAEHLMDHGVITTGSELVAVCEQIKKLKRIDIRQPEMPEVPF